MQVIDRFQDLPDSLRSILLRKFALFAYPIEKLAPGCQLSDDIELILHAPSSAPMSPASHKVQQRSTHPRLEPIAKANNMRVLQLLQHGQLIIDHLFIALDVLFQYDLDSDLPFRTVRLANDAICSCAQRLPETIL